MSHKLQEIWNTSKDFFLRHYIPIGLVFFFTSAALLIVLSVTTNRDAPRIFAVDAATVNRSITPEELALWYIQNKKDFEVLDLRSKDEYERGHLKGAISCPVCHQSKQDARHKFEEGQEMPNFQKKIIVYTETGDEPLLLPRILAQKTELYRLSGGYEAWQDRILKAPQISPEDSDEVIEAKKRAAAISNFFSGKRTMAVPVVKPKKIIKRKHVISSGENEGC